MNLAYEQAKSELAEGKAFSFSSSFATAKLCGDLLARPETEAHGRDLVIRALENFSKLNANTKPIWHDLIEASGLYPYVDVGAITGACALRYEVHRSRALPNVFLHREQFALSALLSEGKSVIVSAPTSFGKSLLIEEIVASKQYANLVIIQPTLALLDETRKKLSKYENDYRILVSTFQKPSEGRNIFLFTGERVVEYQHFPRIDFFVIDEFYKLSLERDDERAVTLNQALYRLLKMTGRFYFLGPNIKSISERFLSEYSAVWHHSDYATVSVDIEKVYSGRNWKERDKKSTKSRDEELFRLLPTLTEPTIIYCSSPDKATDLAARFSSHFAETISLSDKKKFASNADMVEWIEANIHSEWSLIHSLKHGIAFHHGLIPRHLGSSIVDAFNAGQIRYMFCTATLIEGVNTTARNVVLFDKKKGLKPIDFFDYKNIVGRSGRMKFHYVGKVFEFHKEPDQLELDVTVPLFDQTRAPLELLVHLSQGDLDQQIKGRLTSFQLLDEPLKEIIRRHSVISVEGQINAVKEMQSHSTFHPLLKWRAIPTYNQLNGTLELCWKHFVKPGEQLNGVRKPAYLAVKALQYNEMGSLKYLIAKDIEYWTKRADDGDGTDPIQKSILIMLRIARTWFEFKLPKWLACMSDLQSYVYEKQGKQTGNYSYFVALMENSFIKGPYSVLMDYDVPASAIRKLERMFGDQTDWAIIEEQLRTMNLDNLGLIAYERQKLLAAVRRTS